MSQTQTQTQTQTRTQTLPQARYNTDNYDPEPVDQFVDPPVRTADSIRIDWTPPVDNGLSISKYEIRFRFLSCSTAEPCATPDGVALPAASPGSDGMVLDDDVCGFPLGADGPRLG